jgi:hypothetical protein
MASCHMWGRGCCGWWLTLKVHYSVGFDFDERVRVVTGTVPATAWAPALDAAGNPRDDAQVAELTGLLRHSAGSDNLAGWPPDMRIIIRRENPHPGAHLSLFEQHAGKRYQTIATNTPTGTIQFLEAAHRTQARVEDRIRCGKNTGLEHLPSRDYVTNQNLVHRDVAGLRPARLATATRPIQRPRQSRTHNPVR